MKPNYYNELDEQTAEWLRELIKQGHIAPGDVDTRSIEDVKPDDLRGYTQCHFFAGIGVWSYALRRAGWPDDRPIWTGSCPCQPFSAAGKGAAFADERHLWPAFHHLIKVCRPAIVLGEQVASSPVDDWIDLVHSDVEALGYAFGSVPFPSAGVGAPHIRDRNYWVAHAQGARLEGRIVPGRKSKTKSIGLLSSGSGNDVGRLADSGHDHDAGESKTSRPGQPQTDRSADQFSGRGVSPCELAYAAGIGRDQGRPSESSEEWNGLAGNGGVAAVRSGGLADSTGIGRRERSADACRCRERSRAERVGQRSGDLCVCSDLRPGPVNGFWRDADWLGCRDNKWRPVEPGTFPLAYGLASGMGKLSAGEKRLASLAGLDAASLKRAKSHRIIGLRGAGNAINAEAAIAWIETVMECIA